jgi:hypothetical protein
MSLRGRQPEAISCLQLGDCFVGKSALLATTYGDIYGKEDQKTKNTKIHREHQAQ